MTENVVITERQIVHSNLHDQAFDRYGMYLAEALSSPAYIFADRKPNTGLVVFPLREPSGHYLQIVLRIKVSTDPGDYFNSIISCWTINRSRLNNYLRNRKILYSNGEA